MLKTARNRVALGCAAACLAVAGRAVAQDAAEDRVEEPPTSEVAPSEPPATAPVEVGEPEDDVSVESNAAEPPPESELAAMERRLKAFEQELEELRRQQAESRAATESSPPDEQATEAPLAEDEPQVDPKTVSEGRGASPVAASHALGEVGHVLGSGLFLSGYTQAQYEHHNDSENQVLQGGGLLNQNRFLVRRARLKLTGDWQYAGTVLELDANNTFGGYGVYARRAEAYLQYRPEEGAAPLVQLGAGVMDTLFGFELNEASRHRPFMERSTIVRSIWPSPSDIGARLSGTYKWFNYALQVLNGEPQNQRFGHPGADPTREKDLLLRLGTDIPLKEGWKLSGHLSSVRGKGFHPGVDASKGDLAWQDYNRNNVLDTGELQGVPGRAAASAQTFERWAVGIDVQLKYRTKLGDGMVYGEVIVAENMDRDMFYSNPVVSGSDQSMFGYYAAFWQEITPYGIVGFRYDVYEPHSNLFDARAGELMPLNPRIITYAPVVGLQLPRRARLMFQYEFINDRFGRNTRGVPTNIDNNAWTLRLQVQL